MAKVRIEAFCWGAGTALGELPPYFMARAHRLSGYDSDEEEDEFDEEEVQQRLRSMQAMSSIADSISTPGNSRPGVHPRPRLRGAGGFVRLGRGRVAAPHPAQVRGAGRGRLRHERA